MEVNLSVNYPFPPLEGHVTHFGQCLVKVKVKVCVCVCVCVCTAYLSMPNNAKQ